MRPKPPAVVCPSCRRAVATIEAAAPDGIVVVQRVRVTYGDGRRETVTDRWRWPSTPIEDPAASDTVSFECTKCKQPGWLAHGELLGLLDAAPGRRQPFRASGHPDPGAAGPPPWATVPPLPPWWVLVWADGQRAASLHLPDVPAASLDLAAQRAATLAAEVAETALPEPLAVRLASAPPAPLGTGRRLAPLLRSAVVKLPDGRRLEVELVENWPNRS